LVTQADLAAQETVRRIVLEAFPEHALLGEEGTAEPEGQTAFRWILDPLDGTTNYVHHVPFFSISLALEHAGRLLVGAVFDPIRGEHFEAAAGQGAALNGRPIRTSSVARLGEALAAVGFPAKVSRDSPDVEAFLRTVTHCQAIRRTGSAALNLCYVAAGRFDVNWCYSTHAWDIAAGALIVEEAGGVVTAPDGGSLTVDGGRFLAAANQELHQQALDLIASVVS
jgi:myo-inositol-1(or 4)-monophosphatase